jgi:hypothetical protein
MIISMLIILISLSSSCREIFFNDGESMHEISPAGFHTLNISGIFNIILVQDSTYHLIIKGKNDINSVKVFAISDTLFIADKRRMTLNPEKNTIEIHFTRLERIVTRDPVNVTNRGTIKCEEFFLDALGEISNYRLNIDCRYLQLVNSANTLGDFYLKGKASDCYFFNRYGSRIFADSLQSLTTTVINESVGDVRINASENINAFIHGPGDILYHGTPSVDLAEKKGTGNVIRISE